MIGTKMGLEHHYLNSARRRHEHCALAVVRQSQKFHPAADHFPGVRDGQNFIRCRWFTYKPSSVRIDACNF